MRNKSYKNFIFYSGLIVLLNSIIVTVVYSQEVTQTEEITVVAPYEPSVSDAFKINISPKIPDDKVEKPEFNYSIKPKLLQTLVSLEPIVPAKIMGESVTKLYKNYIKAGIGNYITPYIEFFANKLRSKKNAFGVHLKHISSSGKIKDYAYPGCSNDEIDIYGKKFMTHHTLSANAFYKRNGLHYYGYKPNDFPEISLSKKDIKQSFNLFGLNTSFESNYSRGEKLNHVFSLSYYYLFDKFESKEQNIRFDADLNKVVTFFDFADDQKLGVEAKVDYYFNSDTLMNHNSGLIKFKPYYNLNFSQYSFILGLNTVVEADSISYMHFYPEVRAEVQVVKDILITYAGIKGEVNKNSFKTLSEKNPFIISTIPMRFSNYKLDQYGGIKGRITKYLDYNLYFINSSIENMPFFVNDTVSALGKGLNNQFTVVYDKVKYSRVIAEFGFHYKDKFNAMLRGKYNSYFLDNEEKPWHKPALEISLSAEYNLQDKIIIKGEIFTFSKVYARTFEKVEDPPIAVIKEIPVEINGMVDVNLGVEYRYSKLLSGFINFNNILNQRYFRWYNYPSYRFNVMLGVTYSF
ncbi:MAG: TonB-dependent receptor [Bacteroidetes bacterium]|nr:TonB-dependent receptor [Bacteroidota bacterium]MBL7104073.1 TonB-dependent receptor [Bacteroidales bacterium]